MTDAPMTIHRIGANDAKLLENLLQLYIHDLSEIFDVAIGADGRYAYDRLPRYWSDPLNHYAFLIRCNGAVAGFAMVTRGSPATDRTDDLDLAEFFVLRTHRRTSVGRRAAQLLWRELTGRWVVRVSELNRNALPFWERVVQDFTAGDFLRSEYRGKTSGFRVFIFDSRKPRSV